MKKPTSATRKTQGGRPPKDRATVKKYTVVLFPSQWDALRSHAARACVDHNAETDRSGILRILVSKLEAGEITLQGMDYRET